MSFVNKSTSTRNKLLVEHHIIGPLYREHSNAARSRFAITLIGCVDGFERQIKLFTDAGIDTQNIIIVERDYDTYVSLVSYVYHKGYNCRIIHGDFAHVLRRLLEKGARFAVVDFDGTAALNQYHFDLVDLIGQYHDQIDCADIFAALRTPRPIPPRDLWKHINEHTKYSPAYHAYWGAAAMGFWVLTKQPVPVVDMKDDRQSLAVELMRGGFDRDTVGRAVGVKGRTVAQWAAAARPAWFGS